MPAPAVAAIHDLSCFGRCSLTVALPVLSAMGCQCCPLPTALLSAHTGFAGGTFLDLTEQMRRIETHWKALALHFQAIYSGFLGSVEQIDIVSGFFRAFREEGTEIILDPVMGDHGKAYRTCTPALCRGIATLSMQADVITPNLTEAAILLDVPYEAFLRMPPREAVERLSLEGRRSVVLTGYAESPEQVGALCYDRRSGAVTSVQSRRVPGDYPGTGDLFASVLTGGLVRGETLAQAAARAAEFTRACVLHTAEEGVLPELGVEFEALLGQLADI